MWKKVIATKYGVDSFGWWSKRISVGNLLGVVLTNFVLHPIQNEHWVEDLVLAQFFVWRSSLLSSNSVIF